MDHGIGLRQPSSVVISNWGITGEPRAAKVSVPSYTLTGKQLGTTTGLPEPGDRNRGITEDAREPSTSAGAPTPQAGWGRGKWEYLK
jgi:hypothetical protein